MKRGLKEKIASIMERYPETRDDDMLLFFYYVKTFDVLISSVMIDKSYRERKSIAAFGSVARTRRWILSEHPDWRTEK